MLFLGILHSLAAEEERSIRADAALIIEKVCSNLEAERINLAGERSQRRLLRQVRTVAAR